MRDLSALNHRGCQPTQLGLSLKEALSNSKVNAAQPIPHHDTGMMELIAGQQAQLNKISDSISLLLDAQRKHNADLLVAQQQILLLLPRPSPQEASSESRHNVCVPKVVCLEESIPPEEIHVIPPNFQSTLDQIAGSMTLLFEAQHRMASSIRTIERLCADDTNFEDKARVGKVF